MVLTFITLASLLEVFEDYGVRNTNQPGEYFKNFGGNCYVLSVEKENGCYKAASLFQSSPFGSHCIYQTGSRGTACDEGAFTDFLKHCSSLPVSFQQQLKAQFRETRKPTPHLIKKRKP